MPSLWRRLVRGFRKLRQQPDWESFAGPDWPTRIMTEEVSDRFHAKQGRSIGRWTLTAADGNKLVVYLKRHYKLSWLSGLFAALFPSRAWSPGLQEWEHLTWSAKQGVPVPRAVAAGELVGAGGKLQSFLAVEELTGMLPLHEAIPIAQSRLDAKTFVAWKRGLAREMARLARLLHDVNTYHKDLYLCHFYVHEDDLRRLPEDWRNRVIVIDLHRLARHLVTWLWWKVKDLAQLLYSSEIEGVTARDRLMFWQAYRGERKRGLLARMIRMKWKLYRRHNSRR
jgi:heptose I phosphotransferase